MIETETKKVFMVFAPLTDDPAASDDDGVGVGPFKDKDGVGTGLPSKDPLDGSEADTESFEDLKEKEDGDDDLDNLGLAQDDDFNAM